MRAVRADFEAALVEVNDEPHHRHPLVRYPPTLAVSRLANSLTSVSSRRLRQQSPTRSATTGAQRPWSGSYFPGSVGGAPPSIVRQHIQQQNPPVQDTARPLAGLPARAFTTAVNGGALARNPVAASTRAGRRGARSPRAGSASRARCG